MKTASLTWAFAVVLGSTSSGFCLESVKLDVDSTRILRTPSLSPGKPAAGKRVAVTPPEYRGTKVFHTIDLPDDWSRKGPKRPIIFEYTGDSFPRSGSTG